MIIVTGATGKTGGELVRRLRAAGTPYRALVRDPAAAAAKLPPGAPTVHGDLSDEASLVAAFEGADAVYLMVPPTTDAPADEAPALRAAARAGVGHLVKLSAYGAAPDAGPALLRSHGLAEQAVAAAGVPWTVLQPHTFMQNLLGQFDAIRNAGQLHAPMAQGRVPLIDVRDIAAVAEHVLTTAGHAGRTYALTGPEALTHGALAEMLSDALGRPVSYVDVPPADALQGMVAGGIPEPVAAALVELMQHFAAGHAEAVTDSVQALLGRPPHSFAAFLRDHAELLRATG